MVAEQELQQRLRALFGEELQDGLQLLAPGLLALEGGAGQAATGELVQELFRSAHSLKGAAHAAGVPEAVAICDRLESALAAVRDGDQAADSALVTRLLAEVDALTAVSASLQRDDARPDTAPAPAPTVEPPAAQLAFPASAGAAAPPSLRVSAQTVHEVLSQAAEGLVAAQRVHEVLEQATRAAEQVELARSTVRTALRDDALRRLTPGLDAALAEAVRAVTGLTRSVEAADRALHHTSSGVAEAAQRLRTQPFADACTSLERAVRDVAASGGKSARLVVHGEEIDVDRGVIASLRDPLLHLVRNAVDHGLETAQARAAAGKSEIGTVEVTATLEGSLLHVTVRDDGRGLDLDRLRAAAAERGVPVPDELELPFVPGLSSRAEVTAVSGRGVGLDAARARVEQLGGSLSVASEPGAGMEVHLRTPVTLAVLRVLLVRAGQQVVALPTSTVEGVREIDRQQLREVGGSAVLTLDGRSVRAVALSDALSFSGGGSEAADGSRMGLVVPRGSDVVLVTDGLLDEREVAVQPVPDRLAGAPGVLGVALLQGGLPAVVVNPVAVGRGAPPLAQVTPQDDEARVARVLIAEDTVTTRALERSILEAGGYSVAVAVDGLDAWEQLQRDGADLVVSDVDMPRMNGIELCRRIRASVQLRTLPVVLVTSLDAPEDRQRGMEAGADAYVVKGELQQGTLLDTVARLL